MIKGVAWYVEIYYFDPISIPGILLIGIIHIISSWTTFTAFSPFTTQILSERAINYAFASLSQLPQFPDQCVKWLKDQ